MTDEQRTLPKGEAAYILNKLREFEAAQNITIGAMTTRTSFLEKRVQDLEAKHGALVALVYSRGGK